MDQRSSAKIISCAIIAGIIYGISNYISSKINLPGCSFIELRPQVALPMFMGVYFGPLAGFITGFLGDRVGYAFQGFNIGYAWNWSIGNGFIGMLPGAMSWLKIKEIKSVRNYAMLLIFIVAASFLPIVFASAIDIAIRKLSLLHTVYSLILPAFITDAVFGLIIVPVMLIIAGYIRFTIGIRNMLLSTYLLLFAVLTTYMVSTISMWNNTGPQTLNYSDIYNIGMLSLVVLLIGLSISAILVNKIIAPVMSLTDAAREISGGNYALPPQLETVAKLDDEIGCLAAVFSRMAGEIYAREERLKKEVRDLKIEVDKTKQKAEVSKIVDTDYFRNLRIKAKELRTKNE